MKLLRALPLLVLVFASASGCGEKKKSSKEMSVCERYADLEVRCGGYGEGARGIARSTCEDAQKGDEDDLLGKMIKLESTCAVPDTDCDTYKACVEKAKQENSPFD
jgi:hypothetical protein